MHKNMYYKNLIIDIFAVTFRKEGVDWNVSSHGSASHELVTFRKEGVDWNALIERESKCVWKSPSARKVWIEIINSIPFSCKTSVTFRKEGVDWNLEAWCQSYRTHVTFRKEGVDWNNYR